MTTLFCRNHPTQDEFILVQEGVLDLKLDGNWVQAKEGDLVRISAEHEVNFLPPEANQ